MPLVTSLPSLTFLSLALTYIIQGYRFRSVLSLSTSSFWSNFKIFYAWPYQHGKPSFPPFEVHLSDQLPESLERGWKAHTTSSFMAFFFVWWISLSYSFIRPEAKENTKKKGSFIQCITGGPPMDSSNSMNEGRSMRNLFYIKIQTKRKGSEGGHILLNNLTEWGRALYVVSLYHHLKCAKLRLVEASSWRFSLFLRAIPLFR